MSSANAVRVVLGSLPGQPNAIRKYLPVRLNTVGASIERPIKMRAYPPTGLR